MDSGVGLRRGNTCGHDVRSYRRFSPPLTRRSIGVEGAVRQPPAAAVIALASWYLSGIRRFVWERLGIELRRSRCLNYLHRLGFVLKRTRKRLVKANGSKREAFVAEYAGIKEQAKRTGANIFITDEAHFRADCKLLRKREGINFCPPTVRTILAKADIGSRNRSGENPVPPSPDEPDGKWVAPATVLPTVGTPQGHRRRGLSSCR